MIKLLFVLASTLTACTAPVGLQNLHEVDPGKVYRSAQPDADGYKQLKAMGVKSVIKFNSEKEDEEIGWARANGIKLYYYPLSGLLSPGEVNTRKIQYMMNSKELQPLLIHCEWGKDRTGLQAALYRVHTMHWDPNAAFKEWMDYGHSGLLFPMDGFFWKHAK